MDGRGDAVIRLSFYQGSRMMWWPAARTDREVDHVQIGHYPDDDDGGVDRGGEFRVQWIRLGRESSPQLQVFYDAWGSLSSPHGLALIAWLSEHHGEAVSPESVCEFLASVGCRDRSDFSIASAKEAK